METQRERKDRLLSSVKSLSTLQDRVEECLRNSTTLLPHEYAALQAVCQSNDIHQRLDALEEIIAEANAELVKEWVPLAKASYHDFYEFMNREDGFIMSPHQRLIGDVLMSSASKETMRFMLSMPPGHCKSTHSSHHFPAWWFGHNPKRKFLQAGHSQDFVDKQIGAKVKAIIESDDYKLVFPEVRIRADMKANAAWGLRNMRGEYVAKGVGQGIAGFRGHYGMVDDPYKTRKDAESALVREGVFTWYADDFATRLLPGSPLGFVMTRWHSDDLCGRVMDREAKAVLEAQEKAQNDLRKKIEEIEGNSRLYRFNIINLPAICEDEDDVLGRAVGEALWPEVYNLDALANLRIDMTASSWNSLYQGTPMDITGGAISAGWFQRYTIPPSKGDAKTNKANEVRRITVSVDAANTAKQRSDYTVIEVWAEDFTKRHYLLDVIRKQMEFPEMSAEIDRVCNRYEADALLVEAKGNGLAYLQLKKDGGAPCPLIPIEVGTSTKEFRFDKVTPMFEASQVYLPERAAWLADFEKELVAFPNGKHDDQVDACSQYLEWARKKGRRGTKKATGSGYDRGGRR